MNPWGIFDFIFDLFCLNGNWRFAICVLVGITLASFATLVISAEPFRWIVAGAILFASIWIAIRWEGAAR